jgi:hypothetical protein
VQEPFYAYQVRCPSHAQSAAEECIRRECDLLEGGFDVGGGGCAGGVGVAGIGAGNVVAEWRSTQGRVVWRSQWVEMPRAATQGEVVAEAVHRWSWRGVGVRGVIWIGATLWVMLTHTTETLARGSHR